jgi:hypothetical protein
MRTHTWISRTWLRLRYRERDLSTGATFGVLIAVFTSQLILAGLQDWQPVETVFGAVIGLLGVFAGVRWIGGYRPSRTARHMLYYCESLTVVAAIFGDVVINRQFIKFGDFPGWFAAVGTVGALTVSLSLLTRQINERRSSQARQVSAWIEELLLNRKP